MKKTIILIFLLLFLATVNIAQEIEPKPYSKIKKSYAYILPEIPAEYGNLISGQMDIPAGDTYVYKLFFQDNAGTVTVVKIIFYPINQYIPEMVISRFPRSQ